MDADTKIKPFFDEKPAFNTERAYKRIMGSILLALFGKFKCRGNRGNKVLATFEQLETFPLTECLSSEKQNYKSLNYN